MALIEDNLFGHIDKVQIAIDRLKAFEPPEGYYLAFSGGKDSQTIYHLAQMAGVKFDAHYSVTTVDPPELIRFIKKEYPDVEWEYHYWPDSPRYNHKSGKRRQITMWNLIADHTIPPTRQARYCCSQLKETGGREDWSSPEFDGPNPLGGRSSMDWQTYRQHQKNCKPRH